MRTFLSLLSIVTLTLALGCSGGSGDGGGGGGGNVDAGAQVDGGGGSNIDAGGGGGGGAKDGEACTATMEDPTGGCATGYECLSSGAGAGACFQSCTQQGQACPGYSGPGESLCVVSITDQMMNPVGNACGIVCEDTTGQTPCTAETCNGTCPGTWSCVDSGTAGIKICQ